MAHRKDPLHPRVLNVTNGKVEGVIWLEIGKDKVWKKPLGIRALSEDFLIAAPGASPTVPSSQITPSDVTFEKNMLTKDLNWIGTSFGEDKNCWESKDSMRC